MGVVVRAAAADGTAVAIKRLHAPQQAARFEIEARLLARLSHPRVVRVLEYFVENGDGCLVMELVAGEDLRAHLALHGRPGLPVDEAVRLALEACEALAYLHDQHVVHRDVKPQNLVLSDRGVVLVDFGIAREATATREATVGVGTPAYMAPEVAAGGLVSPRADVYGLAATLWALLTGSPPPYGVREPVSAVAPGAGEALDGALRSALALDPAVRLPSVEAFARALGATASVTGGGDSLARVVDHPHLPAPLLARVARALAGLLDAAAVSFAFADETTGELVYEAAWGAGADDIIGSRLAPGRGLAGAALAAGEPIAVADCRKDPRWARDVARSTGYVPHTMLVAPLAPPGAPRGVLSALDRRDGTPYGAADTERARAAAELAVLALVNSAPPTQPARQ